MSTPAHTHAHMHCNGIDPNAPHAPNAPAASTNVPAAPCNSAAAERLSRRIKVLGPAGAPFVLLSNAEKPATFMLAIDAIESFEDSPVPLKEGQGRRWGARIWTRGGRTWLVAEQTAEITSLIAHARGVADDDLVVLIDDAIDDAAQTPEGGAR